MRASEEAARRLAEEATAERARARRDGVPPRGWDVPGQAERAHAELDELVRLLGALRELLPPDLRAQLADLAHRLLRFVRAVLDWWIARLEGVAPPAAGPPVEDIPIA